jgi:hypothetical protein
LGTFEFASCGCRAKVGWASGSNAIEIAQPAANITSRAIFIAVAVNLRSRKKTFSKED